MPTSSQASTTSRTFARVAADDGADDFGAERERALKQYLNSIEQRRRQEGPTPADDDAYVGATRRPLGTRRAAARQSVAAAADDDDDYARARRAPRRTHSRAVRDATAGKQRRTDRAAAAARRRPTRRRARRRGAGVAAGRLAEPGEKREAGRQIERNRGWREQEDRPQPARKNREKFAARRSSGRARCAKERGRPHAGEASGIRKGVSHSRKFAK